VPSLETGREWKTRDDRTVFDRRIIFAGGKAIDILVVPDRVVIALGWSVIRRAV
jgi:hypothetical protein